MQCKRSCEQAVSSRNQDLRHPRERRHGQRWGHKGTWKSIWIKERGNEMKHYSINVITKLSLMCNDKMSIFVRGSEVDNMQTQLSVHSAHLSTAHPWHCQSRNLGHGHPELLIGHAWAGNPFIVGDRGHGTMKHSCGYGYYYLHYGGVRAWHLVTAGTERFCSNTVSLGCNVEDLGLTCYCNAIKWDMNIV